MGVSLLFGEYIKSKTRLAYLLSTELPLSTIYTKRSIWYLNDSWIWISVVSEKWNFSTNPYALKLGLICLQRCSYQHSMALFYPRCLLIFISISEGSLETIKINSFHLINQSVKEYRNKITTPQILETSRNLSM